MQQDHRIARPRIDPAITPFRDTVAFRRYGPVGDPDFDTPEDLYLKLLIEEQDFDGAPHVISRRLLDDYVAVGERELFRGVTAAHHAEAFRTGAFFVGRGIYGGGANAAGGLHAFEIAREYAAGGVVMRLTLKRGARVADFRQLDAFAQRRRGEVMELIRQAEADAATALTPADYAMLDQIRTAHRTARAAVHAEYDDIGRLAAYLGYDAVHAADVDFYAVLNRTAVRVQAEDLR